LLKNSAALQPFGYSFRNWLEAECRNLHEVTFPPPDFRTPVIVKNAGMTLEYALRERLQQTFTWVGPAIAPYMLCDWQLYLWNEERTRLFDNFKLDSFH